ncbi:MAG TPA: UPF0182 family protein [Nitrospirae bacterium]|nr:UPF0182 family protein [Nitrospirota bacterium]
MRKYKIFSPMTFVALFIFSIIAVIVTGFYSDWLFFIETGYVDVFIKTLSYKALSGFIFGIVFLVFALFNLFIARTIQFPERASLSIDGMVLPIKIEGLEKLIMPLSYIVIIIITLLTGQWGALRWEELLLFINTVEMKTLDPIFQKDLGFYLFELSFMDSLRGFLSFTFLSTLAIIAINYLLRGGIVFTGTFFLINKRVKTHVLILAGMFICVLGLGFYINSFKLLYSTSTVVSGAGYTDINARLIALRALAFMTPISAVIFIVAALRGAFKIAMMPILVTAVIYIAGLIAYPMLLQKLKVSPNELALEMPYIQHSINFTRKGFDLDRIEVIPFDVDYNLTARDIEKNEATIKNIRLWDHSPLLRTYSQLQQIRTYYRFADVDNDRYTINGEYIQVMLSPRELSYNDLPSKSWINERLIFTHGNGITMGPVSRISKEGLPEFIIKDIPPVSTADIKVTRPEIYYGEMSNDYVIVKTKVPEFSYPTSTDNVYTSYKGIGGVPIDSILRRVLFSIRFATEKILLSTDITSESRILYNRNISQRVKKLAPFLIFDKDPYLVVTKEGHLVWIIDAYTVTDRFPYSKLINRNINYIRNSVKTTVDAYNGSVKFYISDNSDSLIRVYSKIFPQLFKSLKDMPDDLRSHIRYPQMMLQVQAQMLSAYHMTDPKVFYNKENLWEIPTFADKPMEPYYTIMKLPGGKKEEYILLLPYVPAKRDNLAAWLAARCDGENYGKIIVYTFPRDRLIYGPKQVDARINQDSYISQQLTLWGQRGSQVIRGSLLVIPIEKSLLYVQPLYLSASDKVGLPELRRVIVSYENEVVMEENLESALQRLFGSKKSVKVDDKKAPDKIPAGTNLSREALKSFERAIEMQRQGNWAKYGEELKRLEDILREMSRQ